MKFMAIIEKDDICIEYDITDESFDHAFGREKKSGFEVTEIKVFVPAINDWLDVSHIEKFGLLADNLVIKEIGG